MTGRCRGARETGECAHYAALTCEVRDRKEAGGHSAKLEQRCFFFPKFYFVFGPAADNEIYCAAQE